MRPPSPSGPRSSSRRGAAAAAAAALLTATVTACGSGTGSGAGAASGSGPAAPSGSATGTASPSESGSASPSGSSRPSRTASPSASHAEHAAVTLEVRVRGADVAPVAEQVDLPVGATIVVSVDSDRAGELHVHADPEQYLEFGSGTEEFELTLDAPGAVDIEEHESGALVARVLVR